jgi:hypothetical protein
MNPQPQSFWRVMPMAAATLVFLSVSERVLADGVANNFVQTNLVSNTPGVANNTDPDLINPRGVAFSPTSPFWVSDNATGLTTLYNSDGVKQGEASGIDPKSDRSILDRAQPRDTSSSSTRTICGPFGMDVLHTFISRVF